LSVLREKRRQCQVGGEEEGEKEKSNYGRRGKKKKKRGRGKDENGSPRGKEGKSRFHRSKGVKKMVYGN